MCRVCAGAGVRAHGAAYQAPTGGSERERAGGGDTDPRSHFLAAFCHEDVLIRPQLMYTLQIFEASHATGRRPPFVARVTVPVVRKSINILGGLGI